MATAQEVELLRRQLEELNGRMEEVRQQSANTAMNAAVSGVTEAGRDERILLPVTSIRTDVWSGH